MKPLQKKKNNKSLGCSSYSNQSLAKQTKKILQANGIRLNKNLGQNYLIDDFKRKKIINYGNLNVNDVVLEIGSGIGTLTLEIAKYVKKVVAIEQDMAISKILKNLLKKESIENVNLINKNALEIDFPYFNKIISNLPYQISSPITFKFLEYDFDLAILMYQKEFADRMVANVGDKNYSRLKAMLHFKGNVEFLDNVSPESFLPQPKVTSSIIKLTPLKNNFKKSGNIYNSMENNFHFTDNNEKRFSNSNNIIAIDGIYKEYSTICKALFQHKNKKIKNALIDSRHILGYDDKKKIKRVLYGLMEKNKKLESLLINRTIATSPEEILKIANYLKSIIKDNV